MSFPTMSIRTPLTFALAVVIVVAMSAHAGIAHAQSTSAQAELLFRQGRDLMIAGKLAEACAAFDESEKLEPAPTTLLNLGACREKNGQLASAWSAYLDAERQTRAAADTAGQQLHQISADKAQKLEPRISKLTISVTAESQIDGLEITRSGEHVDAQAWNRALPIDGGSYQISAHARGTTAWTTTVTVGPEGDSKTVDIPKLPTLAPQPDAPTTPTTPTTAGTSTTSTTAADSAHDAVPPPRPPRSRTVPFLFGAGAVALLGGALGFELWALFHVRRREVGDVESGSPRLALRLRERQALCRRGPRGRRRRVRRGRRLAVRPSRRRGRARQRAHDRAGPDARRARARRQLLTARGARRRCA